MKRQQVRQMTSFASSNNFKGLSYSPALLLDAHLSASITDHPHFPYACQLGFESYYEAIQKHKGKSLYSRSQVVDFVWDNLFDENGKGLIPSDSVGFDALHAYFLDRLVPVCAQLLAAAAEAGEISADIDALELMYGIGNLCVGADNDPRYNARRMVELLIAGLLQSRST